MKQAKVRGERKDVAYIHVPYLGTAGLLIQLTFDAPL